MRFTPDFLDRLRNHLSISQVIGKRIQVKKHGREFHALCPFHNEKSPSFTISDEKGFFHCFGCGAHGDSIGFVKDYERISYVEAVEKLANEAGMALPAIDPKAQAAFKKYAQAQDICEEAALWFQKQLLSTEGNIAREYLKARGVSQDMIAQFRIGYSLGTRDGLKQYLLKKGISENDQIEMGLLIKPDNGANYDRFRGRLMFPICDIRGRVVAFGGRILNAKDTGAKYLNSPETTLFKKGEMLYGLHHARRTISDQNTALITEGYLDVIALHQAGLAVAVAPLGTAITEHHLSLLWRMVPDPVLCLDGDAAGARAMMRAAELALPLLKAGFGLKFALLPAGEDPDSMIHKRGVSAMKAIVSSALTLSETLWNVTARSVGTTSPEQRASLDAKLRALTEVIPDNSLKQHMREYFFKQMRSLDAPKTSKTNSSWNKSGSKNYDKNTPAKSLQKFPQSPLVAALAAQDSAASSQNRMENQLVALIVRVPELLQQVEIEEEFARLPLTQAPLDKLRAALIELCGNIEKITHEQLTQELVDRGLSENLSPLLQHAVLPKFLSARDISSEPEYLERAKALWQQMMTVFYRSEMETQRKRVLSDVGSWGDESRMKELGAVNNTAPRSAHFIISEE